MDAFPKFIIETDPEEGDCLIIAKCTYHSQLVVDKSKVKGGGWFIIDPEIQMVTLHGESHDFGRASFEDIKSCIDRNKVFTNSSLQRNITHQFNFQYKNELGEITIIRSVPGYTIKDLKLAQNLKRQAFALERATYYLKILQKSGNPLSSKAAFKYRQCWRIYQQTHEIYCRSINLPFYK